jgi:hypothetical protein
MPEEIEVLEQPASVEDEALTPEESLARTNEDEGLTPNSEQLQAELEGKPEEAEKPEEKEAPKVSRFQARIDNLVAARGDAERRAFAAESELQQLKSRSGAEPKEEDFEHYRDYVKAAARFEVNQTRIADATQQVTDSISQLQTHGEEHQRLKMQEGSDVHADFVDKAKVLGQILHPGMEAYDALFDSSEFTEVAYFLANNLTEAIRIAQLSPRAQAKEITKLEVAIESGRQPMSTVQDLPSKPVRAVSAAPAPARRVLSGKNDSQRMSPEKESMEIYAARRLKEIRGK